MADGQQGIPISDGFTVSKDDNIDKDYIQSILANALGNIPAERRYHGKPIFVLELANRGKYYMNSTLDGWDQFSSLSDAEIETAYNNQVPEVSQAEAEAGIEVLVRRWSPLRVAQAIAALVGAAQNKLDAIIPPTVNNDQTEGYSVGSLWLDTVGNEYYRCSDPSTGAALWPKTTLTTDELAVVAVTGQYSDLLGLPDLSPAGNDTEVQFNDGGVKGASALLRWLGTVLTIGDAASQRNEILSGANLGYITRGTAQTILAKIGLNGQGGIMQLYAGANVIHQFDANAAGIAFINKALSIGKNTVADLGVILDIASTNSIKIPQGTTAQRPATGISSMFRLNTDTLLIEFYDGSQWVDVGAPSPTEERIMFDSNLDNERVIYYNGVLTFGSFNIDAIIIDSLEFETSTDGETWTSHGTIAASGTSPAALQSWINTNGSGNWYLRLSVVYEAAQTLPTGTQWTFTR